MRRIDRLLDSARMLRGKRALRAQGHVAATIDDDWLAEAAAGWAIVESLSEDDDATADDPRRKKGPLQVIDLDAMFPFVERCEAAILAVIEEMRPHELMAGAILPKVCAALSPAHVAAFERQLAGIPVVTDKNSAAARDPLEPRRAAIRDVAVLVTESMLLEVVRRIFVHNDLARPVSPRAHTFDVTIRDGEVVRPRRDRVARRAKREQEKAKREAKAKGEIYVAPVTRSELARRRLAAPRQAKREAKGA